MKDGVTKEKSRRLQEEISDGIKKGGYLDVVVMDEMKLQQEPHPHYHWSIRGKTPQVRFERDRDKEVNFFGGLSFKDKKIITHLQVRLISYF